MTTKKTKVPEALLKQQEQAKKMSNIRKDVALAVKSKVDGLSLTFDKALSTAKEAMALGFQNLTAAIAMKDLTPMETVQVHDYSKSLADAIDEAGKLARSRVLELTLRTGQPVGEAGLSRELKVGGLVQRVTIQKSGPDPKKLEAVLRAKNAPLTKYMEQVVSYKLSDTGVKAAVDDGVLSLDELKAIEYEPSYRVERSKEAKDE